MKNFSITICQREFQFEYDNGTIWFIENKNSFTNYGQTGLVSFSDARDLALVMLQTMGKIKNFNKILLNT